MSPTLNIAISAARKAGEVIVRSLSRIDELTITSKGRNDFVTEVDRRAEERIIETIRLAYPDHAVLGEETGASGDNPNFQWIIDPLDGTTNFLHGFPVFAVSIAFKRRGKLTDAVVYDPLRQELFTATRGDGALLDGKRIRVSKLTQIEGALLGTGFPYHRNLRYVDPYFDMLKALSPEVAGIRRAGAAALDLAYVAAGRLDGFWELGLKPWDIAAGELLVREAGGLIGDISGGARHLETGNVIAGTNRVFIALTKQLRPFVQPEMLEAMSAQ